MSQSGSDPIENELQDLDPSLDEVASNLSPMGGALEQLTEPDSKSAADTQPSEAHLQRLAEIKASTKFDPPEERTERQDDGHYTPRSWRRRGW